MKQNTKQYLKYKDKFKVQGVIRIVASGCMLLTLILFLFLPCFKINLFEDLEIKGLSYSFSLYDEIALSFSHMSDMNISNPQGAFVFMMSIYQVMAIVFIIAGGVVLVKDMIVSVMNTMNLDDYALTEYDKIKSRQDQGIGRVFRRVNSTAFFLSGIVLEIFAIILSKVLISTEELFGSFESITSYFAYMNSVTGSLVVVIIFVLLSIGMMIMKSHYAKTIKMQILKEDYNLSEQAEQEEDPKEENDEEVS